MSECWTRTWRAVHPEHDKEEEGVVSSVEVMSSVKQSSLEGSQGVVVVVQTSGMEDKAVEMDVSLRRRACAAARRYVAMAGET